MEVCEESVPILFPNLWDIYIYIYIYIDIDIDIDIDIVSFYLLIFHYLISPFYKNCHNNFSFFFFSIYSLHLTS